MKKTALILFMIFSLVFTACGGDTKPGSSGTTENAELIQQIKKEYESDQGMGTVESHDFKYQKGDYKLVVYRVFDENYTDKYWFACRFENDKLKNYMKINLDNVDINFEVENSIYPDGELIMTVNEDLSVVTASSIHAKQQMTVDFTSGTYTLSDYEYVSYFADKAESCEDILAITDENKRLQHMLEKYVLPLGAGELAYPEPDGKIYSKIPENYRGSVVLADVEYFTENFDYEEGENCVYVPVSVVHEHLSHLYDGEYNMQGGEMYAFEKNAFRFNVADISEQPPMKINYYNLTDSGLEISYNVYSLDGNYLYTAIAFYREYTDKDSPYIKLDGTYASLVKNSRKDGAYSIELQSVEYMTEAAYLRENATGEYRYLGNIGGGSTDTGFFNNGDVYIMDERGIKIFESDVNGTSVKFDSSVNFPCGRGITTNGMERFMLALRRDPVKMDYIIIYCEYPADAEYNDLALNDVEMNYTYKIGMLDANGVLAQSWDTGVNVHLASTGYRPVHIVKPSENIIEFYVMNKSEECLRGSFDMTTGVYTPIKEFVMW